MQSTHVLNEKFAALVEIIRQSEHLIAATQIKVSKNSSGLYVEELLHSKPNFARILCGSEGRLALFAAIEVQLVKKPAKKTFAVFPFADRVVAAKAVPSILASSPVCIELIDDVIQNALIQADPNKASLLGLLQGGASLWVEWFEDVPKDGGMIAYTQSEETIAQNWAFRSKASKILHAMASHRHPLRCIEDACVPVDVLPAYIEEVDALLTSYDCRGAIFGHIGNGHLHINPWIDVTQSDLWSTIDQLMQSFYAIVLKYGGTISGEHGDGYLRQNYVEKQWGDRVKLFEQVYQAFDPNNRFQRKKDPIFRTF
ncbi:MAG: FAD-linked oxidase C-terminal domain-containing protein [Bdellovibrionota bacterium]